MREREGGRAEVEKRPETRDQLHAVSSVTRYYGNVSSCEVALCKGGWERERWREVGEVVVR